MRDPCFGKIRWWGSFVTLALCAWVGAPDAGAQTEEPFPGTCARVITARVVALDQPWVWNRYGAMEPQGQIFALQHDVVPSSHNSETGQCYVGGLVPGKVKLRRDKRPRPLVLRVNEGDCLRIRFTNLLEPDLSQIHEEQPHTRAASFHIVGMELRRTISDAGANVGQNPPSGNGIVDPGSSILYEYYADREGTFVAQSMGAPVGGEGDAGTIATGLFGAVTVEPQGAEWYRSQVTEKLLASTRTDGNPAGYPTINYDATYSSSEDCLRAGKPKLKMLDAGNRIIHSDLTAFITGPGRGDFGGGYLDSTPVHPNRKEPFREFTIIFHDEIAALQAFPQFYDDELEFTLHSVRDAFAINYGTGGIGAEILANRLEVGPVYECVECLYEEFFLSAWSVGDPAMVVDTPANFPCDEDTLDPDPGSGTLPCKPDPGRKAKRVYYPDDPSNVYHSYLNDHVKFRNLHAGSDDHHVFHLHAHQWTRSPREPNSVYLDSQAIGQGSAFTYEIAYEGSGNRNKTVGDSIFHCHFYPHFAQGMWSMWRVHDVLEMGTELGGDGIPVAGARALPDGEIWDGTPIPGLVPLPNQPLPVLPAAVKITNGQPSTVTPPATLLAQLNAGQKDYTNPGFPFFIPGVAGHRPPHPPLDTLDDGGLARHVVTGPGASIHHEERLDFSKHVVSMPVKQLAETGEIIEEIGMKFHFRPSGGYFQPLPNGTEPLKLFEVNRGRPQRGAPYADPCLHPGTSEPISDLRTYKAADIQLDVVFNKSGWHFPQQRILTLLEDVAPTLAGTRPPEPLFFRANSGQCIEFQNTNLVPNEYELDDFQVRTPTDILGQHIHLVKFDVTSSDGGGNGFNYEDGTFSPEEVQERIKAIRLHNGCDDPGSGSDPGPSFECPEPRPHPIFGSGPDVNCNDLPDYLGAQTTVQRWWADPVLTETGDQTLRTVFTHDHFGPSTHQQVGLYAGLVVEPAGSTWVHNETGQPLSTGRDDGGPTSWQAVIQNGADSYREFLLEFGDFQHAYEKEWDPVCPTEELGLSNPRFAINPPGRDSTVWHEIYRKPEVCPISGARPPCPEAVSADDPGFTVVNYRSEPIAERIRNPFSNSQASHAPGAAGPGDLSFAYQTRTDRANNNYNLRPGLPDLGPYPPLTGGLFPGDPFTPVLRTHEKDKVKIRVLVGAHEEEHNFNIHGLNWLAEPAVANSGWRNSQMMGISEFFDLEVGHMPGLQNDRFLDMLYKPSAATEWQWNGLWGLIRAYRGTGLTTDSASRLEPLPSNPDGRQEGNPDVGYRTADTETTRPGPVPEPVEGKGILGGGPSPGPVIPVACPAGAPLRQYKIVAVAASEALPDGTLYYNWRENTVVRWDDPHPGEPLPHSSTVNKGPLHDPTAILFVYSSDLTYINGRPKLKADAPVEPLILRANAGDCIEVNLHNDLPEKYGSDPGQYDEMTGWNGMPMIIEHFNANDVKPSLDVGLHPQLVFYDVRQGDGANVGLNPTQYQKQTVSPSETITYYWYAGLLDTTSTGVIATPVEFGAVGLSSADPIKHTNKAAVGALIIEPEGSTWDLLDTDNYNDEPTDRRTRALATIHAPGQESFREFALIFQDDVNLRYSGDATDDNGDPEPVMSMAVNEDPQETAQKAFNYRTEPIWFRRGYKPESAPTKTREVTNFDEVFLNSFVGGPNPDPLTPVFTAGAGVPARFRVVHPGGHTQSHVFNVHGHVWEFNPYTANSTQIGDNPTSERVGARFGHGPTNHFDAVINRGAGGPTPVKGDYLYGDYVPWYLVNGMWGVFRVE
ncbi:MAG: copper oxidase [Deltaproteobacteria bacterium]|nr:copper oxidase [Deltaproteobacteria bacterium]